MGVINWLYAVFLLYLFLAVDLTVLAGQYKEEPKYKCPEKSNIIFPCVCLKGLDEGLDIQCDNTNLATLSVAFQNLAALKTPINDLTIIRGQFSKLYGPIFAKVNARKLFIIDTKLEEIDDYAFYGLNNTLEHLELKGSKLHNISFMSFGILGKLKKLIIDQHQFKNLDKNLFAGQEIAKSLEELRLIKGPLKDLPIETFSTIKRLKILDLHGNALSLKRNQFKNLRELEVLDISYNELGKLESQHIADLTKLGWCNVSNNALVELARGTFARNSVLKVLDLSFNKIMKLDVNSFRGMRFLRRLFLNDNHIKEIGRGTFGSIGKIGTIDLARNELKRIEYQMFSQLNYAEVLNLAENNITVVEKNSFKDIYQAVINISHNALELIEPNAFENCVNISVLDLSFNKLKNFSRKAFDETTFANDFQLSHNLLTSLGQIPIQNMTNIRILNASFNNIIDLPKNSFPKLYELHTIDLSYNNISIIYNSVFQSLFSLRFLNLSHNSLDEVKSFAFGTLPTLLELNLSHNNIKTVVRGSLAKLTSLRFLDLSNNKLEKLFQIPISLNNLLLPNNNLDMIPAGTWPVMNSLLYLDLSNNRVEDNLKEDSFTGLLVLQKLLLNNNGITRPPKECLSGMSTLQYLYLQSNQIVSLEKNALGKLPVLFELNLYNNSLKEISKKAFDGLLQLLTLNLSANSLDSIPNEAFSGLPSLRKLDLSFNFLSKFDNKTNGLLDDLLSLEELHLNNNKIGFITKKTFPAHPYIPYNLKYLYLSYNHIPVLTYDFTFGTKKLLKLDLSHNQINEIRRGVLSNLTSLTELDLSYNSLSNLKSEEHLFDLPKNLSKIDLSYNKIYRIPFENFLNASQIRYINLQSNNLTEFPQIMVNMLKSGCEILFADNPLHCSCISRPFKHFLMQFSKPDEIYESIVCDSPQHVQGVRFTEIKDEQLQCVGEEFKENRGQEYDEISDLRFRNIQYINGNLTVGWYVPSFRDIGGFSLFIRTPENEELYKKVIEYSIRKINIELGLLDIPKEKLKDAELCMVSLESNGRTGRWYPHQCQKVPKISESTSFFNIFSNGSSCFKVKFPVVLFFIFVSIFL